MLPVSKYITVGLVILIICILVALRLVAHPSETMYQKSTVDGKIYLIQKAANEPLESLILSANALATINQRITSLIAILKVKYEKDGKWGYIIDILEKDYSPKMISEAAIDKRYTSYTVNKRDVHVCLRTRDKQENVYDINTLMYVMLHELAHMGNYTRDLVPIEGHGEEFKSIFAFLVNEAITAGLYEKVDYTANPQEYCGMMITSSIV